MVKMDFFKVQTSGKLTKVATIEVVDGKVRQIDGNMNIGKNMRIGAPMCAKGGTVRTPKDGVKYLEALGAEFSTSRMKASKPY